MKFIKQSCLVFFCKIQHTQSHKNILEKIQENKHGFSCFFIIIIIIPLQQQNTCRENKQQIEKIQ